LLVLGDGYTTRNLQLITGRPMRACVLENQEIDPADDQTLIDLAVLGTPIHRRQVWLSHSSSSPPLLYATSWWNVQQMESSLANQQLPIGESLRAARLEIFRDLYSLCLGHSQPLEELFQHKGPFWGRYYGLLHQQKLLTLIYEVFSPALAEYLGSAS
jgi:chorismate lyase